MASVEDDPMLAKIHDEEDKHEYDRRVDRYLHSIPGEIHGPVKRCRCGKVKCEQCQKEFWML